MASNVAFCLNTIFRKLNLSSSLLWAHSRTPLPAHYSLELSLSCLCNHKLQTNRRPQYCNRQPKWRTNEIIACASFHRDVSVAIAWQFRPQNEDALSVPVCVVYSNPFCSQTKEATEKRKRKRKRNAPLPLGKGKTIAISSVYLSFRVHLCSICFSPATTVAGCRFRFLRQVLLLLLLVRWWCFVDCVHIV